VSRHENLRDTQSSTPGLMWLHEITKVSTPGWDQSQIEYSRLGPNPKLVLQERTNSKTGTPEKDQSVTMTLWQKQSVTYVTYVTFHTQKREICD